jgi:hypothetical protein
MANKVTITDTKNQVTITPQSSTNIDTSTTNTPVTVTQGTTSVVQVNNPGPIGPTGATGPVGAFNTGDDVIGRNITASGDISSSGDIISRNLSTADITTENITVTGIAAGASGPEGRILLIDGTSSPVGKIASTPNLQFVNNQLITTNITSVGNITATDATFTGNITASGDISASGDIFATSMSLGHVTNPLGQLHIADNGTEVGSNSFVVKIPDNSIRVGTQGSFFTDLKFGTSANLEVIDTGNTDKVSFRASLNGGQRIETNKIRSGNGINDLTYSALDFESSLFGITTVDPAFTFKTFTNAGSLNRSRLEMYNGDSGAVILQPSHSSGNVGIGTNSTPGEKLTVSGSISASGGIQVGTGTFIGSEEAAKTDAALVIPINSKIYTLDNNGGNLRNLISKGSDEVIDIGQNTIFINEIRLSPGTNGFTSFYSGSTGTEVARIDAGGNITASGDLIFNGSQTITTLGASDAISITPQGILNLGTSNADSIRIGRDNDSGSPTAGRVEIFANSSTIAALFATESITFNHPVTTSGDISATRFIASGSNTTSGFVFPNPDNLTDLVSNRITLTSAKNMQFRAGGNFQFASIAEILNGNALMLKNDGNDGKIHLENAGTGIESRIRFRTGSGANVVELMTISGSGKIGIGTTTPGEKLTVSGSISASGDVFAQNIRIPIDAISPGKIIGNDDKSFQLEDGGGFARIDVFRGFKVVTNEGTTSEKARFGLDEVEIKNANFSVDGHISASGNISASGDIIGTNITASEIRLENTEGDADTFINMRGVSGKFLTATDNIGVGTLAPGEALEVVGNISASGNIFATSASFTTLDTVIVQPKTSNQELKVIGGNKLKLISLNSNIEFRPENVLKHSFFSSGKVRINSPSSVEPLSTLDVNGSVSASSTGSFEQIKLNYDNMPTSDPNIKGVVYRSSSAGMDNLLFISPG